MNEKRPDEPIEPRTRSFLEDTSRTSAPNDTPKSGSDAPRILAHDDPTRTATQIELDETPQHSDSPQREDDPSRTAPHIEIPADTKFSTETFRKGIETTPHLELEAADGDVNTASFEPEHKRHASRKSSAASPRERFQLDGYSIISELGRGGMGVVYKARHLGLERDVAIKMILAGANTTPAAIARFITEAHAVARFQHPNIVQIFEIGEHDGLPYFSLEFVDGGPLSNRVKGEPQSPRFAAESIETLARAMHYAHERDVIHRDLKPSNVLVSANGILKITDFGLAKRLEGDTGLTQSGAILGTPSYMSPEQAEGRDDVGPASDVYSLGATLYDLLTGRPPFSGTSVLDTLELVRTREPVPPGQLTGKIPRDIETICLKCLEKSPVKRYATAKDLADDLRRFLEGKPIQARPVSRLEKGWRWAKREPVVAGLSALALTFLTVGIVVSWIFKEKSDQNAQQAVVKQQEAERERDRKEVALQQEAAARKAESAMKSATLDTFRGVFLYDDERMRDRARLATTRRAIIEQAMKDFSKIRDVVNSSPNPLAERTDALAFARMGDLLYRGNKISEAGDLFDKAHVIIQKLEREQPDDPVHKRNLAAIQNTRGDVRLRLGDALTARTCYLESLEVRKSWSKMLPEHLPAKWAIAQSHGLLGRIELLLGEPQASVQQYEAARSLYDSFPAPNEKWLQDPRERTLLARERLELLDQYGDALLRANRFDDAEKQHRKALAERDLAASRSPRNLSLTSDAALSRIRLGDFQFIAHRRVMAALELYARSASIFQKLEANDPDNLAIRRMVAAINYRLGVVLQDANALAGIAGSTITFGNSMQLLERSRATRSELARIDPSDTQGTIEFMLAAARLGRVNETEKLAQELIAKGGSDRRLLFQTACGLSAVAQYASAPADSERCRRLALKTLTNLVASGWKDRVSLEKDPDLLGMQQEPEFRELLKKLRAE